MKIVEDIKRVIVSYDELLKGLELAHDLSYSEIVISIPPPLNMWEKTNVNIDKIVEYKFIEHIGISDTAGKALYPIDLRSLSDLPNLKSITLDVSGDCTIDFSKLKALQKIDLLWSKHFENFSSLINLTDLRIVGYNQQSLEDFKEMRSLSKMILWDSKIKSLAGIEQCVSLKYADIFRAKQLQTLNSIEELNSLEYLHILSCPKLLDASAIFELKNLRVLKIKKCKEIKYFSLTKNSNIEILQLDSISSLNFVYKMPNLKQLIFEDVLDGDLSPLMNHPTLTNIHFPNKKEYSHTRSEIINSLSDKHSFMIK